MSWPLDKASAQVPGVGERWAYRASSQDALVEVVVVRDGVKRPKRILVRFVDDEFEGLQEWIPPARLKVPWRDVEAFRAREQRWVAVTQPYPDHEDPELQAARHVFDLLIDPGLATVGWNATRGVMWIHDVEGLARFLDLEPGPLRAGERSFEEDGDLIVPWPVTLAIARRAAERGPHAVLRDVERDEAEARRDSVYGRYHAGRNPWEVSAETCVAIDEEHQQPVLALRREWAGKEPIDLRNEMADLRKEVARLAGLVEASLDALRRAGAGQEAKRLEQALRGEPLGPPPRPRSRRGRHGTDAYSDRGQSAVLDFSKIRS